LNRIVSKIIGCVAVVLVCLALNFTLLAQNAASRAAKRSDPKVGLSLIVTDSTGKSMDRISKDEVHVFEDKVEQAILSIEPDVRPTDCILLIDSSGSLKPLMATALESARMIVLNRRPDDEIMIIAFVSSDKIGIVQDFTRDGDLLVAGLKSIRIEGGQSAVMDALYLAAGAFAEKNKTSDDRRRAIVIISDGEDRNSFYKLDALIKELHKTSVQVFALGLVSELDRQGGLIRRSPRERAEKLLETVTAETGGRVFYPKNKAELVDSLTQLIGDLRGQFRITYQSTKGAKKGFRKVEVKLISPSGEKLNAIVPRVTN
jgi:Ca-activated chloride channel family protein